MAHQPGIAARAERQSERIQQDRLAGPGLAGQGAQALVKADVEAFDQDDVADRQADQHGVSGIA